MRSVRETLLGALAWLCTVGGVTAQEAPEGDRVRLLLAALDSLVVAELEQLGPVAAAAVLVLDGEIVFRAGYGMERAESTVPVDPDSTVFGLASSSKLFTSIAAVLLESEALVALDRPLDAHGALASRAGSPTLLQLLTHTAGLEDTTVGASSRTPEGRVPLERYLERVLHPPIFPAGVFSSYSNPGYALAGHVLEEAADAPLSAILAQRVWEPLGLTRTFTEPRPRSLERRMALASRFVDGTRRSIAPVHHNDYPATGVYSTASDIGRLHVGLLRRTPPFTPDVWSRLTGPVHRNHPELPGLTPAFSEVGTGPTTVLRHGGDWQSYSNVGFLAPELGASLFVTLAHPDGAPIGEKAWTLVQTHLGSPLPPACVSNARPSDPNPAPPIGTYRLARHSPHTVARLGILTGDVPQATVEDTGAGIRLWGSKYLPVSGSTFCRDDGLTLGFTESGSLHFSVDPHNTYVLLGPHQRAGLLLTLVLGTWLGTALLAAGTAVGAWRRGRRGTASDPDGPSWGAAAAAALAWLYLAAVIAAMTMVDPWDFQFGVPTPVAVLLRLGWFVPLTALPFFLRIRSGVTGRTLRRGAILAVGVLLAYAGVLRYWQLLGI